MTVKVLFFVDATSNFGRQIPKLQRYLLLPSINISQHDAVQWQQCGMHGLLATLELWFR